MSGTLSLLTPMLADERPVPAFSDPAWGYELKYDGCRMLAECDRGKVVLRTGHGLDATAWFPEITLSLATIPGGRHVLDGEVVVLDDQGRSDIERLRHRAGMRGYVPGCDPAVLCAFDVLMVDGGNVMAEPLRQRKRRLSKLTARALHNVLTVDHRPGDVEAMYKLALRLRLEGLVAKKLDSLYIPGTRSSHWLKIERPAAVDFGSLGSPND